MSLKKNNISYFAWLVLLFFTGASCAFFGLLLAQRTNLNILLTAGGLVTLFFVVVFGVYLLIGYYLNKNKDDKRPSMLQVLSLSPKLDWIFMLSLIVLGIAVRVLMLAHAGEEAAYYEVCKITDMGGIAIKPVQGSVYLYCLLLHGLFYVVGNHWIAGIFLQILLQMVGALVLFLGLKKLINRLPAYLVLVFMLFSPVCIKSGITYGPQILYFCFFAVAFYFISDYISKSMNEEETNSFMWLYMFLISLFIGFCVYLDMSGMLLLVLWAILPMVNRNQPKSIWLLRMLVGIVITFCVLMAILYVDAVSSNSSVGNILNAWSILYGAMEFSLDVLINHLNVDFILLITFSCVGCFSFWRRVNTERFTPYILMTIGMAALVFGGITTENMSGIYLLYILFAILASVSVTELFCTEDLIKLSTETSKEIEVVEEEKLNRIEFIENPLPVPKKHVRKTMDYAFIPEPSQMKYDIFVPENDDFDLKI